MGIESGGRVLRTVALIALLGGAAGSLGFMMRVGHRNPSILLILMFTVWVLSPFAALLALEMAPKRWRVLTGTPRYAVMVIVALISLAVYGDVALGPPRPQPAFFFLVIPLVSWVLIAVAALATR
jgi:hypothetical protein